MNPVLPKTRILTIKGRGRNVEEMYQQLSKVKIGLGNAMKGRAG